MNGIHKLVFLPTLSIYDLNQQLIYGLIIAQSFVQ